ncbi:MAG TPA: hypothetical protein VMC03_14485 [Streptosporangiaceae bacterium]|nr:hypothetical protein [Streptosporangiaceae bacterium]
MRLDSDHLEHARRVADAVLYEGYLLYPYRGSAQKNRARFQFGVLVPPAYRAVDDCELAASQTECLVECGDEAEVLVVVRFLQMQRRTAQAATSDGEQYRDVEALLVDDREYTSWDEAAERQQKLSAVVSALLGRDRNLEFHVGGGESAEDLTGPDGAPAGRLLRSWAALDGLIQLSAERMAGPYGALRLRVRLENRTEPQAAPRTRDEALRHSLIAAHVLIGIPGGRFLSLTDPPEWAAAEAAACVNTGTWPVLAGPAECQDLVLSSPVILYDHPEVAAESAGDLFDATEIDEILTLRTLALTDAEKRQARATDPRAAELMDRTDNLPPEMLERMHGAIRYLRSVPGSGLPGWPPEPAGGAAHETIRDPRGLPGDPFLDRPQVPWWDPGADASVSPETDHVVIAGVRVARGTRVRMRPGSRRADAQDLFLVGRTALVEAVLHDVDGQVHVAVSPDQDPVADLQASHGRFLYFAPDELEPIDPADPADAAASIEPAGPAGPGPGPS